MLLLNSINYQVVWEITGVWKWTNFSYAFLAVSCHTSVIYCEIDENGKHFPDVPDAVIPKAASLSIFKPHAGTMQSEAPAVGTMSLLCSAFLPAVVLSLRRSGGFLFATLFFNVYIKP